MKNTKHSAPYIVCEGTPLGVGKIHLGVFGQEIFSSEIFRKRLAQEIKKEKKTENEQLAYFRLAASMAGCGKIRWLMPQLAASILPDNPSKKSLEFVALPPNMDAALGLLLTAGYAPQRLADTIYPIPDNAKDPVHIQLLESDVFRFAMKAIPAARSENLESFAQVLEARCTMVEHNLGSRGLKRLDL